MREENGGGEVLEPSGTLPRSIPSPSAIPVANKTNSAPSLLRNKGTPGASPVEGPAASPSVDPPAAPLPSSTEKDRGGAPGWFGLNPTNFSGAIDIVCVQQPDGTLRSTPFYIRFGKFKSISSTEKLVRAWCNGEPVEGFQMRLSSTGEAYFVREEAVEERVEVEVDEERGATSACAGEGEGGVEGGQLSLGGIEEDAEDDEGGDESVHWGMSEDTGGVGGEGREARMASLVEDLVERAVSGVLEEQVRENERAAAVAIQAHVRGRAGKLAYRKQQSAAVCVQRHTRGAQARREIERQARAASAIGRACRSHLDLLRRLETTADLVGQGSPQNNPKDAAREPEGSLFELSCCAPALEALAGEARACSAGDARTLRALACKATRVFDAAKLTTPEGLVGSLLLPGAVRGGAPVVPERDLALRIQGCFMLWREVMPHVLVHLAFGRSLPEVLESAMTSTEGQGGLTGSVLRPLTFLPHTSAHVHAAAEAPAAEGGAAEPLTAEKGKSEGALDGLPLVGRRWRMSTLVAGAIFEAGRRVDRRDAAAIAIQRVYRGRLYGRIPAKRERAARVVQTRLRAWLKSPEFRERKNRRKRRPWFLAFLGPPGGGRKDEGKKNKGDGDRKDGGGGKGAKKDGAGDKAGGGRAAEAKGGNTQVDPSSSQDNTKDATLGAPAASQPTSALTEGLRRSNTDPSTAVAPGESHPSHPMNSKEYRALRASLDGRPSTIATETHPRMKRVSDLELQVVGSTERVIRVGGMEIADRVTMESSEGPSSSSYDSRTGPLEEAALLEDTASSSMSVSAPVTPERPSKGGPRPEPPLHSSAGKRQPIEPVDQSMRTEECSPAALALLGLKPGKNELVFSVESMLWGRQTVKCDCYLWSSNAKVVISDIDGTITKSDVLGHILPNVGLDWSHPGVAPLFKHIRANGYKVLYLSARPVGQAEQTKRFISGIVQKDREGRKVSLPSGPVLMSHDGVLKSLHREVIVKRPHEFKIACLDSVKGCFPHGWHPFYAGFGNRVTDEFSYREVGVPEGKIFTIDHTGQIRRPATMGSAIPMNFTYAGISETLADTIFPPIRDIEADVGAIHDGKGTLTTPLALSRENSDSSIGSASSTSASVDSVIPGYNNTSTDSPFSASKAATPHRAVQNDGGELEQFNDISFWRAARPSYVLPE